MTIRVRAAVARWPLPVMLLFAGAALFVGPRTLAGWGGGAWFDGDEATQDALARKVIDDVEALRLKRDKSAKKIATAYETGELRFDGQATVAIEQMALLGLGQIVLEHPSLREKYLPPMRAAAEMLVRPETLAYAARVYGAGGEARLASDEGHAYLGYVNLGLGMLRLVDPEMPPELGRRHDRITEALARRLDASPRGMIETYPGESWPPDVAAVAGSIGLHARATGTDRTRLLARWAERFEACAVHRSGLLVQRLASGSCEPKDAPRGSGTAVAAYFLSFATPELAGRLYRALETVDVLGFAGVREYGAGFEGAGDLNAGPIIAGLSVGATGFGLGAARSQRDRGRFLALYRSTSLFGAPTDLPDGRTSFALGGALGNALLLAMLTARSP